MFQFSGLTSDIIGYSIARVGCPIRIFTDQRLFAPPRNFSQLITSFFVSESQGILRTPLLTFFYNYTYRLICILLLFIFSQYVKELYPIYNLSIDNLQLPTIINGLCGYCRSRTVFKCACRISFHSKILRTSFVFVFLIFLFSVLLNLGTKRLCRFGTSFQWRIRESNP